MAGLDESIEEDVVPLQGPEDGDEDPVNDEQAPPPDAATTADDQASTPAETESAVEETNEAATTRELPRVEPAPGTLGIPLHFPLDGGVPDGAMFLGNWLESDLSWYALTAPGTDCRSASNTSIVYVNGSGFTQPLRDPQLTYSGDIAHFALNADLGRAGWISRCNSQLEFYVADLEIDGRVAEQRLVWFGQGEICLLYTSPSPRDATLSRMPSSA